MKKRILKSGFTLVELLIVIALIAILSVAVLATINPIEQSNKARDAKFKNDAAEVLSALERYYASQNIYPWQSVGVGASYGTGEVVGINSTMPQFGVMGVGSSNGVLIETSELKSAFKGKEQFQPGAQVVDLMYVWYNGEDSTYVCFVPKATANRTGAKVNDLKCLSGVGADTTLVDYAPGTCDLPDDWSGTNLSPASAVANLLCVPEGNVAN